MFEILIFLNTSIRGLSSSFRGEMRLSRFFLILILFAFGVLCLLLGNSWNEKNAMLPVHIGDEVSQSYEDLLHAGLVNVPNVTSNLTTRRIQVQKLTVPKNQSLDFADINDVPNIHVPEVNCAKLFRGDNDEIERGQQVHQINPKKVVSPIDYMQMTSDCEFFRHSRHYLDLPVNKEEAEFSIAFSILIYRDIEQFERLLRAIYRPQNVYCVHVDLKASSSFLNATRGIVNCFDNVFLASKSSIVRWGTWTVLEPELTCMKDLLSYKSWRYFINLTGQEFPLKTNLDLVRILKIYNGANNMEGTVKRRNKKRTANKGPLPANITLTKGSVHITACRAFVHYIINNKTAKAFASWVNGTEIPDETFFASLNHSPQLNIPGAYTGEPETNTDKNLFITRFKKWGSWHFDYPCNSRKVGGICIIGLCELSLMPSRPELFVNKLHLEWEHLALDCMEELHYNRTKAQVAGEDDHHLDLEFYKTLDFVRHHINVD